MERAVDGDDVTLSNHLLKVADTSATNLLLDFGLEWLVVVVQELFAVKGLQSSEDTLTDTTDGNGTDDLTFQVVFVLGDLGDVPVTSLDHLVSWGVVSDEVEDGHDDVLGNRGDIGASDLSNGETTVGLVGGVQVDVVGTDTGGDTDLEVLGLGQSFGGQVTRVETVEILLA